MVFKNKIGNWLIKALFIEMAVKDSPYNIPFTLKGEDIEVDGVEYKSLKKIYLSYADPTEYSFAVEILGGWEHWKAMAASNEVGVHVQKWRDELEVKLRSEAIKAIRKAANEDGAKGTSAAKYLAERGWESKRGRPSKEEVQRQRKIEAGVHKDLDDDAKRLGMH